MYKILFGKREPKRPLGRPRRSWKNNTRMDLRLGTRLIWLRTQTSGGPL